MKTLTIEQLVEAGACHEGIAWFRGRFGESVEVSEKAAESVARDIDWDWVAAHFLSAPAQAEYQRVTSPAWTEYERVIASAQAEYRRVIRLSWAEYEQVRATAQSEYERAAAPAQAKYKRVTARTFARLYREGT